MNFKEIFNAYIKNRDFKAFSANFSIWLKKNQGKPRFIREVLNQPHILPEGGILPLGFAVLNNDLPLAIQLLNAGANVNGTNNNSWPLQLAVRSVVRYKSLLMLDLFKKHKAIVDLPTLKLAIYEEPVNMGVVGVLLDMIAEQSRESFHNTGSKPPLNLIKTGLFFVLHNKLSASLQKIFIQYALKEPAPDYQWLLGIAVQYGCRLLLKELLEQKKADFYHIYKMSSGEGEVVEMTILEMAWIYDQYELAELLLKEGFDANFRHEGLRVIHRAFRYAGALDMVLKYGANPNNVVGDECSPLLMAVVSNNKHLVETLLRAGANPNGGEEGVVPPIVGVQRERGKDFISICMHLIGHKDFCLENLFIMNFVDQLVLYYLLDKDNAKLLKFILTKFDSESLLRSMLINNVIVFSLIFNFSKLRETIVNFMIEVEGRQKAIDRLHCILRNIEVVNIGNAKENVINDIKQIIGSLLECNDNQVIPCFDQQCAAPFFQTSRAYLIDQHGWGKSDFSLLKEMKRERLAQNKKQIPVSVISREEEITWFDKKVDCREFIEIENSQNGVRYFLYIPPEPANYRRDCADNIELFNKRPRFIFGDTVKDITGMKLKVSVGVFGEILRGQIMSHEVKGVFTKDRLLCVAFAADNGRDQLLVALRFAKNGVHNKGHLNALQAIPEETVLKIEFPVRESPLLKDAIHFST